MPQSVATLATVSAGRAAVPAPTQGRSPASPLTIQRSDRPKVDVATQPAAATSLSAAGLSLAKKASTAERGPMADAKLVKAGTEQPRVTRPLQPVSPTTKQAVTSTAPGAVKAATSRDAAKMPANLGPNDAARGVQRFGGLNVRSSTGGAALTPVS